MAMSGGNNHRGRHEAWALTKERILLYSGLACIASQVLELAVGRPWSYQFIFAGLALCGVSITWSGDKK